MRVKMVLMRCWVMRPEIECEYYSCEHWPSKKKLTEIHVKQRWMIKERKRHDR